MVSYTHITSCLRVINIFPFVPLLNHPRISPINSIFAPLILYEMRGYKIAPLTPAP